MSNHRAINRLPDGLEWERYWTFVARAERPDEIEEGTLIALNVVYARAYRDVQEATKEGRITKWSWRRAFF